MPDFSAISAYGITKIAVGALMRGTVDITNDAEAHQTDKAQAAIEAAVEYLILKGFSDDEIFTFLEVGLDRYRNNIGAVRAALRDLEHYGKPDA